MKFNINDHVRVKLTAAGKRIMQENHNELYSIMRNPPAFVLPKEDDDGWSSWQLWCLMHEFGSHIRMACELPFESEIEINP